MFIEIVDADDDVAMSEVRSSWVRCSTHLWDVVSVTKHMNINAAPHYTIFFDIAYRVVKR
jgi:hypothetical protein